MNANDKQIGGNHYKIGGEEHWDRVFRLFGPGYFIGNITKYVERYQSKNGLEDLKKAQHYIEKLIELESDKISKMHMPVIDISKACSPFPYPVQGTGPVTLDTEKESMDAYAASLRSEKNHDDTH